MYDTSAGKKIAETRASDKADQEIMVKSMEDGIETVWDRFAGQQPQCGFGNLGVCCNRCAMGPCRTEPFGKKPTRGICGAEADLIVARNLLDDLTTGAAAHSDHGREVVEAMLATAEGRAQGYQILDEAQAARGRNGVRHKNGRPEKRRDRRRACPGAARRVRDAEKPDPDGRACPAEDQRRMEEGWGLCPAALTAKSWRRCTGSTWALIRITQTSSCTRCGRLFPTGGAAR